MKPSITAYDYQYDIKVFLNEVGYHDLNELTNFIIKSSGRLVTSGSLICFEFPKNIYDFRFDYFPFQDRKEKLWNILCRLKDEIKESEIKIYLWW